MNQGGGVTGIVVEKLRFMDFMTSTKIKTARSTAVSNVLKVADSISVLDSFLTRRFMVFQKLFWFDICVKRGYIVWEDGEKEKIWEEAKELALKLKPDSDNLIDRKNHLRKIEEGNIPRAKALAFKLAVWRKVLLRD